MLKTYQLKFLAWTFSAFLPPDTDSSSSSAEQKIDYYDLLEIPRNATSDDIKKAYRKRSLQLHPDKLRQRGMRYNGQSITEDEARSRFQQMKAAYDTLSDPKKRRIYDALGHRGMDYVINPSHAYDPHVLLGNLAKSSVFDRAKLMALVLLFFGLVLLQPILICAKVDQDLAEDGGALEDASWVAILVPFWIFAALYGVVMIIGRAVLPLLEWISFVCGILFLTLKFDDVISWDYAILFIPFYVWMALRFVEARKEISAVNASMAKMVTIEYIEKYVINEKKQDEYGNDIEDQNLWRTYNDLNEEERDDINGEYIIVHVPPKPPAPSPGADDEDDDEEDDFERIASSPEYQEAKLRHEIASKSISRIVIPEIPQIILIAVQLDMNKEWNWGLVFLPLWISLFFDCCGGCYGCLCTSQLAHIEVQEAMADHIAKEMEAKSDAKEGETKNSDGAEDRLKEVLSAISQGLNAKNDASGGESKDKNDGGAESKDGSDEKGDAINTTGEGEGVKTENDATASSKKSDTVGGVAESDKSNGIDAAIVVEPPKQETTTSAESDAGKVDAKPEAGNTEEAKVPDDVDDDDMGAYFQMDEDMFYMFQQAEVEAENKATEAQSKAISQFCNIIFQTLIAALFVAKLNQVYEEREEDQTVDGTSSFSTFWILFPFLLISGCIISCFACAIFCAADIDNIANAGDNGDNDKGDEEAADKNEASSPVIPTPPPPPQEDEAPSQKTADESIEVSNIVENAGNEAAAPAAEATDSDGDHDLD